MSSCHFSELPIWERQLSKIIILKAFVKDSVSTPFGVWTLFFSIFLFATTFMAILDYYTIQTGKEGFFNWITKVTSVPLIIVIDNIMGLFLATIMLMFAPTYRMFEKQ
jgi:hypothetical protein